jgi:hypothetical protein
MTRSTRRQHTSPNVRKNPNNSRSYSYCTYDFFERCPHRMACAKCDFYMPKQSSAALLLEGKANLLRLLQ